MMVQSIDLLPMLGQQRRQWTATVPSLLLLGVVLAGLLMYAGWGVWRIAQLGNELGQVKQRVVQLQATSEQTRLSQSSETASLELALSSLQRQDAQKRQVLAAMPAATLSAVTPSAVTRTADTSTAETRPAGETAVDVPDGAVADGFSIYLAGLARQHQTGIALSRITILSTPQGPAVTLVGQADRARQVPAYLQGLGREAVFSALSFSQLSLNETGQATMFEVHTRPAGDQP